MAQVSKNLGKSSKLRKTENNSLDFRYSFVMVPRLGDSEGTCSVFESSCHLLLPV